MYLDVKGLVALWRETLLAQKVLQGNTKGYKNHPQLTRFKNTPDPLKAIGAYLKTIHDESIVRKFKFAKSKIQFPDAKIEYIKVSEGQLLFEYNHLREKLKIRSPNTFLAAYPEFIAIFPFHIVDYGNKQVEPWEKV